MQSANFLIQLLDGGNCAIILPLSADHCSSGHWLFRRCQVEMQLLLISWMLQQACSNPQIFNFEHYFVVYILCCSGSRSNLYSGSFMQAWLPTLDVTSQTALKVEFLLYPLQLQHPFYFSAVHAKLYFCTGKDSLKIHDFF